MTKKQAKKPLGCRRQREREKAFGECRRRRPRKYDAEAKTKIILEYGHIVKFIAHKLVYTLPANIEVDDLISVGLIGLMEAAERYDSSRGYKFKTFAEFRIRGAMIDELRRLDWVPRNLRDKAKQIENAKADIELETGTLASIEEIAKFLGIKEADVEKVVRDLGQSQVVNIDDFHLLSQSDKQNLSNNVSQLHKEMNPYEMVSQSNTREVIAQVIKTLPEKEQRVLAMYYFEEMSLKEISTVLKITESRVSQIHSKAIKCLKEFLSGDLYEEFEQLLA